MAKQMSIAGFLKGPSVLVSDKDAAAKAKKRDGDKVYDKTVRKRVWREAFKDGRPWLEYDKDKGRMYCKTCRLNKYKRADTKSAYVTSAICFQTSSINKHAESTGHCREDEAVEASTNKGESLYITKNRVK